MFGLPGVVRPGNLPEHSGTGLQLLDSAGCPGKTQHSETDWLETDWSVWMELGLDYVEWLLM